MAGQIHRRKKETGFVVLDVHCLQNTKLKWDAKGLHSYLMQLPDNWKINITDLETRSASGREATASPMRALIEAGYVTRSRVIAADGKFEGYDYEVFETPQKDTVNGFPVNGLSVNGLPVNGKPVTIKNEVKEELIEITHSVVSHETTAFSSPIESELHSTPGAASGATAWAVEVFEPATLEIVETEPAPLPDSTDDTQPGDPAKTKHAYVPEFEAFWKSYNYAAGSKLTASKRWERLSAKEKTLALSALDAHLRGTTTDKSRRKDVPFLPMRCHAAVYLSEKRWEAYGEQSGVQRGESTITPWDEKYKAYLKTCENKWPDALASVAYLSKTEYCAFQEGKFIQGIGRITTKMQKARLGRCHDKWERAEPEARKHSSIWQFFLLDMSNCIKLSNSI